MTKEYRMVDEIIIAIFVFSMLILFFYVLAKSAEIPLQSITGQAFSTVNVIPVRVSDCNFTMHSGLNLVSFYCIANNAQRSEITNHISGLEAIYEYEKNSQDLWKTYNPNLPVWVIQDLEVMGRIKAYWVRVSDTQEVYISGGLRIPNNIEMTKGWNLVGYPTNRSKDLNSSFASIEGNFSEVRKFDAINKVFLSYVPSVSSGFNETKPYEGYWINMTSSGVWVVD